MSDKAEIDRIYNKVLEGIKKGIPSDKLWDFVLRNSIQNLNKAKGIELVSLNDAMNLALTKIEGRMKGEISKGISTGFPLLDTTIGFLQPASNVIIGARPGTGKTTFKIALQDNIFEHNENDDVAIAMLDFNFEVTNLMHGAKFLSKRAGKTMGDLMSVTKPLSKEDFSKVTQSITKLKDRQLYSIDVPVKPTDILPTIANFSDKFRTENQHKKEVYIFLSIDHTLLATREHGQTNRDLVEAISSIAVQSKKIAGTTNLILSQIKEEAVKDDRKKEQFLPRASDLAWSQNLEQDADTIFILHSPNKFGLKAYNIGNMDVPTSFSGSFNGVLEPTNLLVCSIPKNKYGATGQILFKDFVKYNTVEEISNPESFFSSNKYSQPRR